MPSHLDLHTQRKSAAGALVVMAAVFVFQPAAAQIRDEAELVLHNGRVLTVDARFSVAQAVAIKEGLILDVGRDAEILRYVGPSTRLVDLHGSTVIPGLIDSHAHMDREGLKYLYPSLEGARSIDDILNVVAAEVRKVKPGEWIVTMPVGDPPFYDDVPGVLRENRLPTRWDLDKVSPNNPVYIRGIWPFWNRPPAVSVANSYALKVANVTGETPAPHDGVTIVKDPTTGEPTGVFSDAGNFPTLEFSLMKAAPRFTHDQRVAGLRDSVKRYNAAGITSVYEGHGVASEVVRAYKALWTRGELTVRSYLVMSPTPGKSVAELDEMMRDWATAMDGPGFGDAMLKIGGMSPGGGGNPAIARILMTGSPYTGWGGFYSDISSPARARDIAFTAARYGIRLNAGGTGQQAIDNTVALFEEVNAQHPIAEHRWVINHITQLKPQTIDALKRLGVVPMAAPAWSVWRDGASRLKDTPEPLRVHDTPFKSILDAGVPLVLATDNVPPNPFFILWTTLARTDRETGMEVGPEQRLSREQALRAMTINGAFLTFEENAKGSIERGKYADLVVIPQDYLSIPVEQIKDIKPTMTMVGGRVVFERK